MVVIMSKRKGKKRLKKSEEDVHSGKLCTKDRAKRKGKKGKKSMERMQMLHSSLASSTPPPPNIAQQNAPTTHPSAVVDFSANHKRQRGSQVVRHHNRQAARGNGVVQAAADGVVGGWVDGRRNFNVRTWI